MKKIIIPIIIFCIAYIGLNKLLIENTYAGTR